MMGLKFFISIYENQYLIDAVKNHERDLYLLILIQVKYQTILLYHGILEIKYTETNH